MTPSPDPYRIAWVKLIQAARRAGFSERSLSLYAQCDRATIRRYKTGWPPARTRRGAWETRAAIERALANLVDAGFEHPVLGRLAREAKRIISRAL